MLMDRGKGAEGEARTAAVATLNRRPNTGAPVRDPPPQVPLQRWTRFALPPDARPLVRVAYPSARLRSPKPISTPAPPSFPPLPPPPRPLQHTHPAARPPTRPPPSTASEPQPRHQNCPDSDTH